MKPLRDLLKHSSIYMVGQILTRMASVLLLPLYTHLLSPADYGVTAILDLTASILSVMLAGGMVSAVTRYHFDDPDPQQLDRVWWTGVTWVAVAGAVLLIPMYVGRQFLADVTLGEEVTQGAWFYTLTLITIWFSLLGLIIDAYLRVLKWSGVFVVISLGRLILNIGLNVWLLVGMRMGVEGLLIGNLTATIVHTVALSVVFCCTRGRYAIDGPLAGKLFHFSAPLIVTALTTMIMHEADRYVIRLYQGMDEVGIYSLAHKIGFAIHTMVLLPFISIWHVAIYDIEKMENSRAVFGRMFGWFTSGLGILLLGASLTVHPILPLLTPEAYGTAIDLIAVILLGFFMFALSFQFEVPALLSKKTTLMIPGSIAGLIVNVGANFCLVPFFGGWGAGWAGVLTYIAYSSLILFRCRTAIKIDYPWRRTVLSTTGMVATYIAIRYLCFPTMNVWEQLLSSVGVCATWAVLLFGGDGVEWLRSRGRDEAQKTESEEDSPSDGARDRVQPELVGVN